MRFATKPMAHQLRALEAMQGHAAFALLMEQGTGKTKVIIDDAARLWADSKIDAMFVVAPNGVHIKWVTIELPKHMPDWVPYQAAYYTAGGSKRHQGEIEKLFEPNAPGAMRSLRILTINYEAVNTTDGIKLMDRFLRVFKAAGILDESQRIKTPSSARTKAIMRRRQMFPIKRIMTGTPITNTPFDAFSQFAFLDPHILRTTSFSAFKAEYADMLPAGHQLVRNIVAKNHLNRIPQIVARDRAGRPIYRNIDKLHKLIAPHSFRVLKKDCLDLPDKVYDVLPFEMTPRQTAIYMRLRNEQRAQLDELPVEMILQAKIQVLAKLQQVTCGYLISEDGTLVRLFKKVMDNPRNAVLMEQIEDTEGQVIVWAPHTDKINQIIECLQLGYERDQILRYDGATGKQERMEAVDKFQEGKARFFVGNPASGGTGLNLSAAQTAIYYSNSFNLEHRLQSEDRSHRIGTKGKVCYYDLEAIGTIDRDIVRSNQSKKELADIITGDSKI